jgi:hypothetical protein
VDELSKILCSSSYAKDNGLELPEDEIRAAFEGLKK